MQPTANARSRTRLILAAIFCAVMPHMAMAHDDDRDIAKFKAISEPDAMVIVPMRDGVGLADVRRLRLVLEPLRALRSPRSRRSAEASTCGC